uniref:Formate dehydrogenase n=3 Tax=Hirondellea gigas TaxID=1518452 RepID=A0A6A7G9V6_9CRUS
MSFLGRALRRVPLQRVPFHLRPCALPSFHSSRGFATNVKQKVVCALYDPPADANPAVLGSTTGELGIRKFLEDRGVEYIVTADKDGPNSVFAKEMKDATVVISQPFWPAYITADRIATAPNLKMAITAGVGSDHVDLQAACDNNITVIEVTGSNVVSVAEHVVMTMLILMRNFIPAYNKVITGKWDIADIASNTFDLEGKSIGTVAAGRIGYRVLQRLKPFNVDLHYTDYNRLSPEQEKELGATYHETVEDMVGHCDIITINCPLHPQTEHMFNTALLNKCKKGAYIVNTARGKIMVAEDLAAACESGQIRGYGGDVWFPQPAPVDHPWRSMPNHAMTPHVSGTSIDAQIRYAHGTEEILQRFFDGEEQRKEYLIADGGKIVSPAYSQGNTTGGSH